MKIRDFASNVCQIEGKKEELTIAQVLEVLRCVNVLTVGALYKLIRETK